LFVFQSFSVLKGYGSVGKQTWNLGSSLRREATVGMAQGLMDGYSGGRAKAFRGEGQGGVGGIRNGGMAGYRIAMPMAWFVVAGSKLMAWSYR
jgi:hypothetical protein